MTLFHRTRLQAAVLVSALALGVSGCAGESGDDEAGDDGTGVDPVRPAPHPER